MGPLDGIAARAGNDPFFLGWIMNRVARVERWDDVALAAWLGCEAPQLSRLRLCRSPAPERFREEVCRIAEAFGLAPDRLASLVQRGTVMSCLEEPAEDDSPSLMAARDREDDP